MDPGMAEIWQLLLCGDKREERQWFANLGDRRMPIWRWRLQVRRSLELQPYQASHLSPVQFNFLRPEAWCQAHYQNILYSKFPYKTAVWTYQHCHHKIVDIFSGNKLTASLFCCRKYVEEYATDQDAFFSDYAEAHKKLSELGAEWVNGKPITIASESENDAT